MGDTPIVSSAETLSQTRNAGDLTVNALYYNLTTNQVLDPTGQGIIDINNKVLRFVGKPSERLAEDYLRGWRFLRFLKKLEGFEAHPKSLRSVRENWDNIYIKTI